MCISRVIDWQPAHDVLLTSEQGWQQKSKTNFLVIGQTGPFLRLGTSQNNVLTSDKKQECVCCSNLFRALRWGQAEGLMTLTVGDLVKMAGLALSPQLMD